MMTSNQPIVLDCEAIDDIFVKLNSPLACN